MFIKRFSGNMQHIYRRILNEIILQHGCSPVNLLHIFKTPFPKNTSGKLLINYRRGAWTWVEVKRRNRFLFFHNTEDKPLEEFDILGLIAHKLVKL